MPPRIDADAATVVEHRARQQEQLLDAAEALLIEGGYGALTFQELGKRAGLARSSVYRYFANRDEVIAVLCERELPRWMEEIEADMNAAAGPSERLDAYVERQLKLVAGGHHRLAKALAHAPLGPLARSRINAIAYEPTGLLEAALREEGEAQPELKAQLVQGVVNAAARILHQADPTNPPNFDELRLTTARSAHEMIYGNS